MAAIGLAVLLLGQAAAVAYWGGGIRADLRTVVTEVRGLRSWKHDTLVPWTTDIESRVSVAEEKLTEHDRRFSDNERGAHG